MTTAALRVGDELTGRELEILELVADGLDNIRIGERLGLSALTVKSHMARIAKKLGTGDRAGMVGIAYRTGLLTLSQPARFSLPEALAEEMLALARLVVAERPLGTVRESARRVVALSQAQVRERAS